MGTKDSRGQGPVVLSTGSGLLESWAVVTGSVFLSQPEGFCSHGGGGGKSLLSPSHPGHHILGQAGRTGVSTYSWVVPYLDGVGSQL